MGMVVLAYSFGNFLSTTRREVYQKVSYSLTLHAVSDNYTQIRNLPSVLLPAETDKQKSYHASKMTSW